ncbi:MAG TPA: hypothetical protein PKA06_04490 [Gemmatales bacterium]|nr:hypothetical protein [Gemmatales bacterium]
MAELDADIQRFLHDEPIYARPIAWWERVWKAARQRPTLAGLVLTAIAALGIIMSLIILGNRKLQEERDHAEEERNKAMVAMKKAEQEQIKAQKRLEKAVEAVEKLLTRTAGENWARRPELQEERKILLEEAVNFYRAFLEQESEDPLLRREAARVYYRMAGVYLMLGETGVAQETLQKTKELQESLCKEFPENTEYQHDLVKTVNFLGNAQAMQGEMNTSLNTYQKAARQADALAEAFPDNLEFQITQVRTHLSLSYFFSQSNLLEAQEHIEKALEVGKKIYERDPVPYVHQLSYIAPRLEAAQMALNTNQQQQLSDYLREVKPLLDKLANQMAPTAQDRDQYDSLLAKYTILHGYSLVQMGKNAEGEEELRKGVELLDGMLVQRPKMFPFRMLQMNALQTLGEVQDRQQKVQEALYTMERVHKMQDQIITDLPHMKYLRQQSPLHRSMMLVMRAREGVVNSFERSAEDFLRSRRFNNNQDAIYNIACGYAQASEKARDQQTREKYAKRAVQILTELYENKYFTTPRIVNMLVDSDLHPIRQREDFQAFLRLFGGSKPSASDTAPTPVTPTRPIPPKLP